MKTRSKLKQTKKENLLAANWSNKKKILGGGG